MWKLAHLASVVALAVLVVLPSTGCDSGLPSPSAVTVTITPPEATIKTGATVSLTGNAVGFTSDSLLIFWGIEEYGALGATVARNCFLAPPMSDMANCPCGIIVGEDSSRLPILATYYAPPTPGSYHIRVEMSQTVPTFMGLRGVSKSAIATITVIPST